MENSNKSSPKRLKGRFATKKQIIKRQKIIEGQQKRRVNSNNPLLSHEKLFPIEGRRIIEVETLAKNLQCKFCKGHLFLNNIESSKRHGLAEVFVIRCETCLLKNDVSTSKQHSLAGKSKSLRYGALSAGMGITHVNKFLAGLNIPPINAATFKLHEREVGPQIENAALESCKKAAELERALMERNFEDLKHLLPRELWPPQLEDANEAVPIFDNIIEDDAENQASIIHERIGLRTSLYLILSYDMSWPKRGNGKNYDSLCGFGTFIGHLSGKIIDFAVRNKKCKMCSLGHDKFDHNCRLNFHGSAKAMEADVAAAIARKSKPMEEANVKMDVLIGDEDSCTIAAVKQVSSHDVVKWSDTNHVKSCFSRALYRLATKHKELTKNSYQAIKYVKRCFAYAIHQNKGNPEELALSFQNLPAHVFNKHDQCGIWCKYVQNPSVYKHSLNNLLQSQSLYIDLVNLLKLYQNNAFKIAPCGSSQANESVNNIIHVHAPKNRFYGASESYDFRVASGVCSKNVGMEWTEDVHKRLQLSPVSASKNYYERRNHWNKWRAEKCRSNEYKMRRLILRQERKKKLKSGEKKEGINYESGLGLHTVEAVKIRRENVSPPTDMAIVFFDTETSGFKNAEILQIGAKCGEKTFCCYILPQNEIPAKATEIHGLSISNGNLMKNNSYVPSEQLKDALKKFLHFLIAIGSPCLLVGHNINFDARHFLKAVCLHKMENDFDPWVYGFADSLQILKKLVTDVTNHKLSTLAENFELLTGEIHDALVDAKLVEQILEKVGVTTSSLISATKSYNWHLNRQAELLRKAQNLGSLQVLEGIVSKTMRGKMAEQGILFENLKEAFTTGSVDGIRMLLGENLNGKPRVTKHPRIINKIGFFMEQHIQNMQID